MWWIQALTAALCLVLSLALKQDDLKFSTGSTTWTDAQRDCRSWGGSLITPSDQSENFKLWQMMKKRRYFGSIWLGISDTATEGKWVSAETNEVPSFTSWYKRAPSSSKRLNCAMMRTDNGRWTDIWCDYKLNYVCKRGKASPSAGTSEKKTILNKKLPSTTQQTAVESKDEFKFSNASRTWCEAKKDCIRWSGSLASPTSTAENFKLYQLIKNRRYFGSVWLGISDAKSEGKWVSAETNAVATFTYWYKRAPSSSKKLNCAMMRIDNGHWTDIWCDYKLNYVCKREKMSQGGNGPGCGLSPHEPVKTVAQITTRLQIIVNYCEKKIGEIEARKKRLQDEMNLLESQNAKFAQEKRAKEKKVKGLNEDITRLTREIGLLQQRISTTVAHRDQVTKRIVEAGNKIVAASNRVNQLVNSIRSKQAHIAALERKINKEKAKRRCHFGRKRRSIRAPRVRRGWRVRRVVRNVGRAVRKVTRETKRVVKQVVTLPKCIVDNIVSRLSRSKEKAEREKNNLNNQLLQAQREKVNLEGEQRKLIAQRNSDNTLLGTLNTSLGTMRGTLTTSNNNKAQTNREIATLDVRIVELANLLRTTDNQLKFLRETKTKVLRIRSQLQTIRNEKLGDLNEMEEAGDDAEDFLEEIEEINETIKKSVGNLIDMTCGSIFNKQFLTGGIKRVMRLSADDEC